MKRPTALLTALLSTAAIAGSFGDVYVRPNCYINGQPQWSNCPQTPIEPAYYRSTDHLRYLPDRPSMNYGSYTQPTPLNTYDTPSRSSSGGLYVINPIGNGNVHIMSSDGTLTSCSSTACITP
jgi:hypothetical protein